MNEFNLTQDVVASIHNVLPNCRLPEISDPKSKIKVYSTRTRLDSYSKLCEYFE